MTRALRPMPFLVPLLALLLAPVLVSSRAAAEGGAPGRFDFYVLALSWSPSYCADRIAEGAQCGAKRPHAFVVHGLWPQYADGFPESCQRPAPFVPEDTMRAMGDIMPSRGLVLHEWRKHGTCSGLDPNAYFDLMRRARAKVAVPPAFTAAAEARAALSMSPGEVEAAFRAANPGLEANMVAVACGDGRLTEVRVCFDRGLAFHACPAVDRRACRTRRPIAIPAPR